MGANWREAHYNYEKHRAPARAPRAGVNGGSAPDRAGSNQSRRWMLIAQHRLNRMGESFIESESRGGRERGARSVSGFDERPPMRFRRSTRTPCGVAAGGAPDRRGLALAVRTRQSPKGGRAADAIAVGCAVASEAQRGRERTPHGKRGRATR